MADPEASAEGAQVHAIIRIVKAHLTKNFETFGKMDPQATLEWKENGESWEVSRTRIDWNGHMTPQWDHTCRGVPYAGRGRHVQLEFKVFEADVVGKPTLIGQVSIPLDDLLEHADTTEAVSPTLNGLCKSGPVKQLHLVNKNEETGTITVQALLSRHEQLSQSGHLVQTGSSWLKRKDSRKESTQSQFVQKQGITHVPAEMFETPVSRIGVSGGTAPFFSLELRKPSPGQSRCYFIGKDLSHAWDEIQFYEKALDLKKRGSDGLEALLSFTLEYAGVLTCREKDQSEQKPAMDLLVMRNLRDGYSKLRMLDIKMGQKTGQAGWQGKSLTRALKQALVDGVTNSSAEGFRLEGFDSQPWTLDSMDPLLDLGTKGNKKVAKKASRMMLQRMEGQTVMMHFLDLHCERPHPGDKDIQKTWCHSELTEIVLHETVKQLATLAVTCRKSPVPHKWLGSSVALGFDCGPLPARTITEAELRSKSLVKLFDWGRSELNSINHHMMLSDAEQRDRAEFWGYYVESTDRLAWEAARYYYHRFNNADDWTELTMTMFDFDSLSANDFIGRATVKVEETPLTTVTCVDAYGHDLEAKLTYSIHWCSCPPGARLKGVWIVRVEKGEGIPNYDKILLKMNSDPMCELTATPGEGSSQLLKVVTTVKAKTLAPTWEEQFELPVLAKPGALQDALSFVSRRFTSVDESLFPQQGADSKIIDNAFTQWVHLLDTVQHKTIVNKEDNNGVHPMQIHLDNNNDNENGKVGQVDSAGAGCCSMM